MPRNNTSGVTGVCWDQNRGKWLAFAVVARRQKHIGRFSEKSDAEAATREFRAKHGFTGRHGADV